MSANLETLARAATPGPWRECLSEVLIGERWVSLGSGHGADAAYVAAAHPQAVLALLEENKHLRAERERLTDLAQRLCRDPEARAAAAISAEVTERDKRIEQLQTSLDFTREQSERTRVRALRAGAVEQVRTEQVDVARRLRAILAGRPKGGTIKPGTEEHKLTALLASLTLELGALLERTESHGETHACDSGEAGHAR